MTPRGIMRIKRREMKGEGMKTFEVSFWKDGKVFKQVTVTSYSFVGAIMEAEAELLYLPDGHYDAISITMKE